MNLNKTGNPVKSEVTQKGILENYFTARYGPVEKFSIERYGDGAFYLNPHYPYSTYIEDKKIQTYYV